jgi:hypothetical protein
MNSKDREQLMKKLKEISEVPIIVEPATVLSVDVDQLTCVVQLLDETEIPDVRLKAGIDGITDGLLQFPKVESVVLVGMIGNKINTRFVILYSEVDEVRFFNGENGGLVIWPNTKTELDKVKDLLTAIVNVLDGAPIPEPGSGAPSALQNALKTAITGKTLPSFEDLVNDKVKH